MGEGLLNIAERDVTPYPVTVASGSSFTLAVTIDLLKEVAVGTSIKLKIVKEGLIDFPLQASTRTRTVRRWRTTQHHSSRRSSRYDHRSAGQWNLQGRDPRQQRR